MDRRMEIAACEVIGATADDALGSRVHECDSTSGVDRQDSVAEAACERGDEAGLMSQCFLGATPLAPLFRLPHLARERQRQATQVALHHVVVRTGTHGLDRALLADYGRCKNEWQSGPDRLDQPEGIHATETGHGVVGYDRVPRARGERVADRVGGI